MLDIFVSDDTMVRLLHKQSPLFNRPKVESMTAKTGISLPVVLRNKTMLPPMRKYWAGFPEYHFFPYFGSYYSKKTTGVYSGTTTFLTLHVTKFSLFENDLIEKRVKACCFLLVKTANQRKLKLGRRIMNLYNCVPVREIRNWVEWWKTFSVITLPNLP